MDKKIAQKLMESALKLSAEIDTISLVMSNLSESDKDLLQEGVGDMMKAVYVGLMRPIIKQYPELDPDQEFTPSP